MTDLSNLNYTINGKKYIAIQGEYGEGCGKCSLNYKGCLDSTCSLPQWAYYEEEVVDIGVPKNSQGVKYDSDKLQYTLIPPLALKEVARNLTIGLKKYPERNNWKKVENAQERYLDALYRHLEAHRAGELFDPDSSVPDMYHLAAVAVNAMFLLEFMLDEELKNKE